MTQRTFSQVAQEIIALWPKPYFGAVPYLRALSLCDTTDPHGKYWFVDIGMMARDLLATMTTFRGPDARRLKAELKNMLK